MLNLMSAGFYRLSRSTAFRIFVLYSALCGALSAVSTCIYQPETGQEFSLFGFAIFIPMFAAPFTAVILGSEFSDNTVRNKIIAGHTRAEIYFSYIAVAALASAAMCVLSAAVHFIVGLPILGFTEMPLSELALFFAIGILSTAAMTVITAVITVCTHSRAAAAAVCAVAATAMIVLSAEIGLLLKESEYLTASDFEAVTIYGDGLTQDDRLIPNPNYPTPQERERLEFLYDFLPGGAAVQCVWLEAEHPARVLGFEILWLVLPAAAGYFVFEKRNLK